MLRLYAIIDKVASLIVGNPYQQRNDNAASRIFCDAAAQRDSIIAQHPQDFELLCLGDLDEQTWEVTGPPRVIITGEQWAAAANGHGPQREPLNLIKEGNTNAQA